jgi:hypothetical protein
VQFTVEAIAILTGVVADMVVEVTSTVTPVEVVILTVVVMEEVETTVVELVEIACLTWELVSRSRLGVS